MFKKTTIAVMTTAIIGLIILKALSKKHDLVKE